MPVSNKLAGKFIVIEGLEGAGKSTAISYINKWLIKQNIKETDQIYTREPGGTILAEKMRDILKMDVEGETLEDKSELLLMYAARVQLVEQIIKPALDAGKVVIGDRHNYSSLAYQGGGREIPLSLIKSIKEIALGDFKADFTLYLDIAPKVGLERAQGRGELDRFEREELKFFDRTRDVFLSLAHSDQNCVIIDAELKPTEVEKNISAQLDIWLSNL